MKKTIILAVLCTILAPMSTIAVACSPVETVVVQTSLEDAPVNVAVVSPRYEGGEAKLMEDISKSIKYPKDCLEKEIQGLVVLHFTITKKGKLQGIKVLKSLHPSADAEAIRVMRSLPGKWKPGLNEKGKPVNIAFTLPVLFKLR